MALVEKFLGVCTHRTLPCALAGEVESLTALKDYWVNMRSASTRQMFIFFYSFLPLE
jgi:hypothetical protein